MSNITDLTVKPEVEKGIKSLTKFASDLNVQSVEDASEAGIKLYQIAELKKAVEDQRTEITKPLNLSLKSINAFFKRFSEPLEILDAQIREKVVVFGQQTEETVFGVIHFRKNEFIEVEDMAKLPRKYMMPDLLKIKADLKQGKKIAGIKITERKSVSL